MSNDVRDEAMSARVEAVWAASGAFAVVLFACGLLFGDLLATTNFPALNAAPSQLREYFLRNGSDVRALSFFHLLAAAALAHPGHLLHAPVHVLVAQRGHQVETVRVAFQAVTPSRRRFDDRYAILQDKVMRGLLET